MSTEREFRVNNLQETSGKRRIPSKRCRLAPKLYVLLILLSLTASAFANQVAFAQALVPVVGASVTASSTTGGVGYGTATSNAQGFYNVTSFLDAGNYSVTASAIGFIDTTVQNVRVTTGQETPNTNIVLPVSGGISGRVTDAVSGSPLSFVAVQAINTTNNIGSGSFALTDANGNYQMYHEPGNWKLQRHRLNRHWLLDKNRHQHLGNSRCNDEQR